MKNKTQILILDDSKDLLEALNMFLEKDYTITTTTSKNGLYKKLEFFKPDIIILDVFLDGQPEGREICKQLKSDVEISSIPVLLMSANPAGLLNFEECKADAILEKPFNLFKLSAIITSLTRSVKTKNIYLNKLSEMQIKSGIKNAYVCN
ncbi:MAG: response regulator [Bacteroidota bacterium]|nr:response regulator [Bacteroidota bacterium]